MAVTPPVNERRNGLRLAANVAGGVVASLLVAQLVLHADTAAIGHAIGHAGPLVFAALLPFAAAMTIDAHGTAVLLRALGHPTTAWQMLPVRLASEALHISIPAGVIASDAATAALLDARYDVPLRDGLVASIARRWLVMRAHTGYMVLGTILGFATLAQLSRRLLGGPQLPWIVLASALVPLSLSALLGASVLGRSRFAKLHAAMARIPWPRLTRWLETRQADAAATDGQVVRMRAARGATTMATLTFVVVWFFETLESALILRIVGASVPLTAVFAIEAGMSLVRSAAVIAPSGLGVVDLGYASVLPLLGADSGAAPAFVLLKRAKEVVWVLAGYAVLATLRARIDHAVTRRDPASLRGRGPWLPSSPTPVRRAAGRQALRARART
jgi:hypothetical protein